MTRAFHLNFILALCLLSLPFRANAEEAKTSLERAKGPKLSAAMGHYARARALLLSAIREFDKGYDIANPNAILDSNEWRSNLIERAKDLERVLDPQPRATNSGVRYDPDTRLLGEAKGEAKK